MEYLLTLSYELKGLSKDLGSSLLHFFKWMMVERMMGETKRLKRKFVFINHDFAFMLSLYFTFCILTIIAL